MPRILIITHETTRTGAPLVLLGYLQWLQQRRPNWQVEVLSLKGGELEDDYRAACLRFLNWEQETTSIQKQQQAFLPRIRARVARMGNRTLKNPLEEKLQQVADNGYDLVFASTVLSVPMACQVAGLCRKRPRLIAHIHEMQVLTAFVLPNFIDYVSQIDHFVGVSVPVQQFLIQECAVPSDRVSLVYEFSPQSLQSGIRHPMKKTAFVVGGSGTVHWRKGCDFFLQVARYYKDHYGDHAVQFRWVGKMDRYEQAIIAHDIERAGLQDWVQFSGAMDNPADEYAQFDVLLLTSREDPFPLVAIELAQMGKPIICFEGVSGTANWIEKGGGFAVPYMNVEAMAERVYYYRTNADACREDGKIAAEIFSQFNAEATCGSLAAIMEASFDHH